MAKIKNLYWKIFFSAYWFAVNLGEKKTPEWNASGFVEFIYAFNLIGLIFIVNFIYGGDLPFMIFYVTLAILFSIFLNEFIIRSKKNGFKKQIKLYEYLSKPEMRKTKNKILLITLISTFVFMSVSVLTIKPSVRVILLNLFKSI